MYKLEVLPDRMIGDGEGHSGVKVAIPERGGISGGRSGLDRGLGRRLDFGDRPRGRGPTHDQVERPGKNLCEQRENHFSHPSPLRGRSVAEPPIMTSAGPRMKIETRHALPTSSRPLVPMLRVGMPSSTLRVVFGPAPECPRSPGFSRRTLVRTLGSAARGTTEHTVGRPPRSVADGIPTRSVGTSSQRQLLWNDPGCASVVPPTSLSVSSRS